MMNKNKGLSRRRNGNQAELQAIVYLQSKGWAIVSVNLKLSHEEIDIVARTPDGIIHLVEVRSKKGSTYGCAVESVSRSKKYSLWKSAHLYMQQYGILESNISVDLVAIDSGEEGTQIHLFEAIELF